MNECLFLILFCPRSRILDLKKARKKHAFMHGYERLTRTATK